MQYNHAMIFHKRTDLLPFFYSKYNGANITSEQYARIKAEYARERDVQLILLVRYEHGKMICRIKCPVNPMPISGEFTPCDISSVVKFLIQQGWAHKDTYNLAMFR